MILPVFVVESYAVHRDLLSFPTRRSSDLALNVPVAVPPFVMATDPAGVEAVPGEMLSLTNTVHVTCWPTATEAGEHVTTVVVDRRVTVTVLLRPKLPLWVVSLGV